MRPRRIIATPVIGVLFALGLVGCKAADALATQEVVVHFAPGTPESEHIRVQQTCGAVPHASARPIPTDLNAAQTQTDVRFLVNPASGENLSRLIGCLNDFKGVVLGYDLPGM